MLFAKYLLLITGAGLLLGAAGILIHDLLVILKTRREQEKSTREDASPFPAVTLGSLRWRAAGRLAAIAAIPLFLGLGSQTPGARGRVLTIAAGDDPFGNGLRAPGTGGLTIGLAIAVRFRLDHSKPAEPARPLVTY